MFMGVIRLLPNGKIFTRLRAVLFIFLLICIPVITSYIVRQNRTPVLCPHCNVLLITVDTLSERDFQCDPETTLTPNLCSFADNSVRFTHTYAQNSWTMPNLFSIMTSQYASTHRMINRQRTLSENIPTLPQVLHKNGYATVYVGPVDHPHFPINRGIGRGYEVIIPYFSLSSWIDGMQKLRELSSQDKPAFLYMNTFDTQNTWVNTDLFKSTSHFTDLIWNQIKKDYDNDGESNTPIDSDQRQKQVFRNIRQAADFSDAERFFDQLSVSAKNYYYDGQFRDAISGLTTDQVKTLHSEYEQGIRRFDKNLVPFFDYLKQSGILQNTIVIITGTHGEAFGEHGGYLHSEDKLFDEEIRVPLLIRVPSVSRSTNNTLIQSIDIFPTILGLTGIKKVPELSGIDVGGQLQHLPNARQNTFAITQHGSANETQAIRSHTWKLLISNDDESQAMLFDLQTDPGEHINVAAGHMDQVRFLHGKLRRILQNQPLFK